MERILKRVGAIHDSDEAKKRVGAIRVSNDAKIRLGEVLEEIALQIAHNAVRYTHDSGKKTVTADVIKLATESFLGRGLKEEEE